MNNKNIKFLKDKYELHKNKGVHNTANRSNKLQGTNISMSNIEESIGNFLERYDEVLRNKDINPQSFEALKKLIFQENIIKPENIPDSYWEFQKRIIINQGRGGELINGEIPEQVKKSEIERILKEQKISLLNWVNYLSDPTCPYDISMKYFILRNIITVDSDFGKRNNSTVNNFPELNQEHLARTMDLIQKSINGEKIELENKNLENFAKNKNFVKIYEFFSNEAKLDNNILENTKGEWRKYDQKSDHMPLVKSLEGKNTGWITVGEDTAKYQLSAGDFYVYYSQDKDGNNTFPRVAIRMEGEEIAEIKGILPDQKMDKYILPVLSKKLEEFGDKAEKYREKERDMFFLTAITEKLDNGEKLTEKEMRFLFEINKKIKNFGYKKDPRIGENINKIKNEDFMNFIDNYIEIEKGLLNLSGLTSLPENIKFPENISLNLDLSGLPSLSENIKFPKNIKGSLNLSGLTSLPENFKFPENFRGSLDLSGLTSLPENFKFPENINGNLDLSGLPSLPENFKFPENIKGILNLSGLTSLSENFKFPEKFQGSLNLSNLTSLSENFKFPKSIFGSLDLSGLTSLPENFKFPEYIGRNLKLSGLTSLPENIKFPEKINGNLELFGLTSLPENFKFPENILGILGLHGLTSLPENITFPENFNGSLDLSGLTSLPENITFPENINGNLELSGLTSLPENVKFPENINGNLELSGLTSLPKNIDFLIKLNGKLMLNSSLKEEFEKKSKEEKYSSKFKIKNFFKTLFKK